IATSADWIATVPVFTHCAYFAVWNSANFCAKAAACLPGKGWPPHFELDSTSSSARDSSLVGIGHVVRGAFRRTSPPVIANFPTCEPPILNEAPIPSAVDATAAGENTTRFRGFTQSA